jgi:nucleotide-binding universal stress UspA family protein
VNISSMLVRLQTKLNLPNLAEEILLLPPQEHHLHSQHCLSESADGNFPSEINLLVGYSNSRSSQVALDLTLCIALQTRLVVSHPVTVQVVYVVEEPLQDTASHWIPTKQSRKMAKRSASNAAVMDRVMLGNQLSQKTSYKLLGKEKLFNPPNSVTSEPVLSKAEQFEKADSILWQARSLAEEWRGSLKTHLRFGEIGEELSHVAKAEKANLLIVGCESKNHPLVTRLGRDFPCPILGIPQELFEEV